MREAVLIIAMLGVFGYGYLLMKSFSPFSRQARGHKDISISQH